MIRSWADVVLVGLFLIGSIGFVAMAVAFGRLFRQAWRSEERGAMVLRVVKVQPRKSAEWPNVSREADWIAIGALFCLVFIVGLLAFAFFAPECLSRQAIRS